MYQFDLLLFWELPGPPVVKYLELKNVLSVLTLF